MIEPSEGQGDARAKAFEEQASLPRPGLAGEFLRFLLHNKKWWLAPILLVLLLVAMLILLGGTPAGPFIYTWF